MSDPINTDGLLIVRHGPDPFSLGTLDDFRRLTEIDPDFISHTASRQHIRSLLIDMVTELHRQHAEIERLTVERDALRGVPTELIACLIDARDDMAAELQRCREAAGYPSTDRRLEAQETLLERVDAEIRQRGEA